MATGLKPLDSFIFLHRKYQFSVWQGTIEGQGENIQSKSIPLEDRQRLFQMICYSLVSHGPILRRKFLIKKPWKMAEGMGFEPTIRLSSYNGLANRRLQPLGHPSTLPFAFQLSAAFPVGSRPLSRIRIRSSGSPLGAYPNS